METRRRKIDWPSSKSKPDWRSLNTDLLESILDYLAPVEDYLAFSEVCIEWRSAVVQKIQQLGSNHKRHCRQHQRAPWFPIFPWIPSRGYNRFKASVRYELHDVVNRQSLCSVEPWPTAECICEGSSHGWLILFDHRSGKVFLREPFSAREIRLPPFREQPSIRLQLFGMDELHKRKRRFNIEELNKRRFNGRRYAFSNDPDLCPDLKTKTKRKRKRRDLHDEGVVLVMMALGDKIGFIRLGNRKWTYIKMEGDRQPRDVIDIVYSNGTFFVLNRWGLLYSISISNDGVFYKVKSIVTWPDYQYAVPALDAGVLRSCQGPDPHYWAKIYGSSCAVRSYLVESPEGDLFRVVKPNCDKAFVVYKLIWFSKNPRWERVTSLGNDVALFLGFGSSISLSASDFPGCHSNSIYFTDGWPNSVVYVVSI